MKIWHKNVELEIITKSRPNGIVSIRCTTNRYIFAAWCWTETLFLFWRIVLHQIDFWILICPSLDIFVPVCNTVLCSIISRHNYYVMIKNGINYFISNHKIWKYKKKRTRKHKYSFPSRYITPWRLAEVMGRSDVHPE